MDRREKLYARMSTLKSLDDDECFEMFTFFSVNCYDKYIGYECVHTHIYN